MLLVTALLGLNLRKIALTLSAYDEEYGTLTVVAGVTVRVLLLLISLTAVTL